MLHAQKNGSSCFSFHPGFFEAIFILPDVCDSLVKCNFINSYNTSIWIFFTIIILGGFYYVTVLPKDHFASAEGFLWLALIRLAVGHRHHGIYCLQFAVCYPLTLRAFELYCVAKLYGQIKFILASRVETDELVGRHNEKIHKVGPGEKRGKHFFF